MASEEMGLVSTRQVSNGLIFHDTFNSCGPPPPPPAQPPRRVAGDPGPKTTRELTSFIDKYDHPHHQYFHHQPPQKAADFRRQMFSGDPDDDVDDDDDDDDDDEDENEVEGIVTVENSKHDNNNNNSDKVNSNSSSGKIGNDKAKSLSTFGVKEGNVEQPGTDVRNAVTIASVDGDMYYSNQYVQEIEGSNAGQKEMGFENGCGFSGRKEGAYSSESGESLRAILSDPITGALMDDAMILPCGHSFGSGGVQHVIRMKACYICSQAVSEDLVAPNLSLRDTVRAFRREEELQLNRCSSKRRRERYDQDIGTFGESALSDLQRGRGVQFPFAVTDRVIIKGNKRTPPRFVGREAVVTTQCLNGWYVVKTLDNAESVKLQYRSLAKVSDNLSTQPMSSKTVASWL